jgi:hypothetical protein
MFTRKTSKPATLFYHLVKERGYIRRQNPFKEGQKKTLDKFEIIRKLETIRTH